MITLMDGNYMALKDIMVLYQLISLKRFKENYITLVIVDGALERLYSPTAQSSETPIPTDRGSQGMESPEY